MTIGSQEIKSQKFVIRNTNTRKEESGNLDEIISFIRSNS